MFVITGTLRGVQYTAVIGDSAADHPDAAGIVTGSPNILEELDAEQGRTFPVTPTGPYLVLDLENEASILVALWSLTKVDTTEGDVPALDRGEGGPPGAVY